VEPSKKAQTRYKQKLKEHINQDSGFPVAAGSRQDSLDKRLERILFQSLLFANVIHSNPYLMKHNE